MDSAASVFVVGGSLGEMVLPIPVGQLIENKPMSFLYFMLGYAVLFVFLFLIMLKVGAMKSQIIRRWVDIYLGTKKIYIYMYSVGYVTYLIFLDWKIEKPQNYN